MHHLVGLFAGCLLYAGSADAAELVKRLVTQPGIVLETGIQDFHVGQPVPGLLERIGPLLDAAGTEELRVADVAQEAGKADPVERAASPERAIRLVQFIRGLEVRDSSVTIVLNIRTNELMLVSANFLSDRGLDHEPRLTAAQAKAKVEARMGSDSSVEINPVERVRMSFDDTPAQLAYDSEQPFGFRPARAMLVWVFNAEGIGHTQLYQVSVSAATGDVIGVRGLLTN